MPQLTKKARKAKVARIVDPAILADRRRPSKIPDIERKATYMAAFGKFIDTLTPDQARNVLLKRNPSKFDDPVRKKLFITVYDEMWPETELALKACGADSTWMRKSAQNDMEFAANLAAIEMRRNEQLKSISFAAAKKEENVAERMFWLKKRLADEFGDEPPKFNIMQIVMNSSREQVDFKSVDTLLANFHKLEEEEAALKAAIDITPKSPPAK